MRTQKRFWTRRRMEYRFKKATGDIFGWLGSHDFYPKNSLDLVLKYFDEYPTHMFLYE